MELDSVGKQCPGEGEPKTKRIKRNKTKTHEKRTSSSCGSIGGPLMIVLVLLSSFQIVASLRCYHCLEKPKSTEKHLACAYFDMSERFHKECTHSSMCMKRTSSFQLHNGSYVTIHVHKCADQSHKTMVQDENGDWKWAQLFKRDLYNEGCFPHNTPSMLNTDSYHCFCSTDFCNKAGKSFSATWLLYSSAAVLILTNVYLSQLI